MVDVSNNDNITLTGKFNLINNEEPENRHDDEVEEGEENTNEVNTSEEDSPVDTQSSN